MTTENAMNKALELAQSQLDNYKEVQTHWEIKQGKTMTTESDKELLELAAKAAEIELNQHGMRINGGNCFYWNPLTDDGDALRLAIKCHIDLCIDNGTSSAIWIDEDLSEAHEIIIPCDEFFEGIEAKHAATRRAIVSAAGEIGRSKK